MQPLLNYLFYLYKNNFCLIFFFYLLIRKKKVSKPNYYFLSQKGNLKEAAKNLYAILRKIKKDNYKSIAVDKIPNIGIGKTINDRLLRASKF